MFSCYGGRAACSILPWSVIIIGKSFPYIYIYLGCSVATIGCICIFFSYCFFCLHSDRWRYDSLPTEKTRKTTKKNEKWHSSKIESDKNSTKIIIIKKKNWKIYNLPFCMFGYNVKGERFSWVYDRYSKGRMQAVDTLTHTLWRHGSNILMASP